MKKSHQNTKRLLWLCYSFFGIVGFILGMRTSVFYYVQEAYLVSYSHIANMILVSGLCMQVSLYLTGLFIEKLGYKKVLNLGLGAFVIPVLLLYFVSSFMTFALVYTLFMFTYGIAVMILNLYVSALRPKRKSNNLMMLHLFFCIGALLGPKWMSFYNGMGVSWQQVTALSAVPLILILILTLNTNVTIENENTTIIETPIVPEKTSTLITGLFIVVFMCSQVWEYGIGTWFIIFATHSKGKNAAEAATLLTVFYGMYPLVRIVLFKVIHRMDLQYLLIGAFLYSAILATIGAVTGLPIFYSLTGAGAAVIYPAFMAFMQEKLGGMVEKKIGFITMVGGLFQYLAIWSVGLVSDIFGIGVGFTYMVIYLFIGTFGLVGLKIQEMRQVYALRT